MLRENRLSKNWLRKKWLMISAGLILAFTQGCARSAKNVETTAPSPPPVETAIDPQLLNDAARFIAGLPGRPQGAYHELEATAAWHDYAGAFDKTWTNADAQQFVPVRAFEERELKPAGSGASFLFYPFSGPDVLYATQFFPRSTLYIMAGLEPVGNLPLPGAYRSNDLANELRGLRTAAASIFRRSFFITNEMKVQYAGEDTDGLLPVIVMLLARSGYMFDGMRLGDITAGGVFAAQAVDPGKPIVGKHSTVELVFHSGSPEAPQLNGPRKTLYYVSTDLGGRYDPSKGFGRFVASKGPHDTMIKSASYLLHATPFASLRQHILQSSSLILQDDTGIPYRTLHNDPWHLQLLGHYSAPSTPFKNKFQKDLATAFEEPGATHELGFHIGYGYGQRTSSLILATRKGDALNAASPPPTQNVN